MRLPSNGIGFSGAFMRGSRIIRSIPRSRVALSGQMIQPAATTSSGFARTALRNEVNSPSGTSSSQASSTDSAPHSMMTSWHLCEKAM